MKTVIPAGYRLSISSWENDWDMWYTNVLEGLSKERVEMLIAVCKLFVSSRKGGHGNAYEPDYEDVIAAGNAVLHVMMVEHPQGATSEEAEWIAGIVDGDDLYDFVVEYVSDLFGSGGDFTFRAFDSAKVELIPEDILIEDVSKEFGV